MIASALPKGTRLTVNSGVVWTLDREALTSNDCQRWTLDGTGDQFTWMTDDTARSMGSITPPLPSVELRYEGVMDDDSSSMRYLRESLDEGPVRCKVSGEGLQATRGRRCEVIIRTLDNKTGGSFE